MHDNVLHLLTVEYSLILATSQEHLQAVKDIRAEVFISRLKLSSAELESRNFLINQDDKQSFIYLLQHNATKKYVGSVRLIFVNEHTQTQTIPIERDGLVSGIEHLTKYKPICEISRLALTKNLPKHNDFSMSQLRGYLSLALMSATRINFFLYHYSKIFAMMERSLHLILKRQSVAFELIGDAVDYYGVRFPYVITNEDISRGMEKTEKSMGALTKYHLLELCKNPEPFWQFIDNNPYLERSDIHLAKICQVFKEYGEDITMKNLLKEMNNFSIES
ncbi:hypothetical protein [Sulfurovum sp.]|uniref:hypothetical protein n=1 Tax=Sulfurovum sp. TaxID=1969726 RepID=UPI002867F5A8|nr:hypothetical protein [Sulfurovum sp.]